MSEEFIIELARLEREVYERLARKRRAEQKGEAWEGLDHVEFRQAA